MAVDSKHPEYSKRCKEWERLRDSYEGEEAVKAKGTEYLKPTQGMVIDGMQCGQLGLVDYEAYLDRAVFPDFFRQAVETHMGFLNSREATIELPEAMEFLREKFSSEGESMVSFLKRMHEEQLITGRMGLLADIHADGAEARPYVALYNAENIINWDDDTFDRGLNRLNMVVLDESNERRVNEFEWSYENRYRVLSLGELPRDPSESGADDQPDVVGEQVYRVQVCDNSGPNSTDWLTPMYKGKRMETIPFVFVNTKDLLSKPDRAPFSGLSRICFSIYRGEADYRQSLHKQGQDTLVVVGGTRQNNENGSVTRTGTGAKIDCDINGDAKFIGVSSQGLFEQRLSLENDRTSASMRAGQVLPSGKSSQESGEALQTRINSQTATLNQIASSSADALQKILRYIAVWMGLDENDVHVIPNTEFADYTIPGQELVQLMTARNMGAPLSLKSIHEVMVDRGLTQMDYESEKELWDEESAEMPAGTGGNPDNPNSTGTQTPPEDNE